MSFDRDIYFAAVRGPLFGGSMSQNQVDGQNAILDVWEKYTPNEDVRWLAYMLATTKHETASEMQPVEEYGRGQGMAYGTPDPETGQTYYGRGFVQLTWRDNYAKSDSEIASIFNVDTSGDMSSEWHADLQLKATRAMLTMYLGMAQGWFRSDGNGRQTLDRYFNDADDDPFNAREIINGDKNIVPDWTNGVPIGNIIMGYHDDFHEALMQASEEKPQPDPSPDLVTVGIQVKPGTQVAVYINGQQVLRAGAGDS